MTYWLPILQSIGMRVPDTAFVHYPHGSELFSLLDGEVPNGVDQLTDAIDAAVQSVGGYPVFIRTEQSSDKHSWKDSCYLPSRDHINTNIAFLVEHSAMADWPCDFFAVRRLIPTSPICTAFYGDMPIARERRLFIKDGKVVCNHPYWPNEAFEHEASVSPRQITELQELSPEDSNELQAMARYIAQHIPGAWSVDFLVDSDGKWWCIDMAVAANSYHWSTCPNRGMQIDVNLVTGERTQAVPEQPEVGDAAA